MWRKRSEKESKEGEADQKTKRKEGTEREIRILVGLIELVFLIQGRADTHAGQPCFYIEQVDKGHDNVKNG